MGERQKNGKTEKALKEANNEFSGMAWRLAAATLGAPGM